MNVRKAVLSDIETIMAIYATARDYMKANGNPKQWGDHHPVKSLIEKDIAQGQSYVILDQAGMVHGVFALVFGDDPTYAHIEDGAWLNDHPYGTIHRIAGDGQVKGLAKACFDFCKNQVKDLRCDTHHDNLTMQEVMVKNAFTQCGVIYVEDGSPRIAYHYVGSSNSSVK